MCIKCVKDFTILNQTAFTLIASVCTFSDGMLYTWTSPVLPILLSDNGPFSITSWDQFWLEEAYLIAGVVALPISTYTVNKIGPHKSIKLTSIVALVAWILIIVATRVEYLYISRFLGGLTGNLAYVAAPVYVSEIANENIRGMLTGLLYISSLTGMLIMYSTGPFTPIYVPASIAAAILLLQICLLGLMPDSPQFLLRQGNIKQAQKSLIKLRSNGCDIEKEIKTITTCIAKQEERKTRMQDIILEKSSRRVSLLICLLVLGQNFSGISVILMNFHTIIAEADSIYLQSEYVGILFTFLMLVAAILCSFSIDKYGRKVFLISSSILTGISLLVLAIYFNLKFLNLDLTRFSWIPVVCVTLYAALFKIGLGVIPQVIAAECFPTKVKALGMSLTDGLYLGFGVLSVFVYKYLMEEFGFHAPFYMFATTAFLTGLFSVFFVPETRGKTLEQIRLMFEDK